MGGVHGDTGHRADLHTLGFIKMAHTFGAFAGLDFINLLPEVDGLVGAFGFAHVETRETLWQKFERLQNATKSA